EVCRRRARELALVQFTSGTSARARGVAVRFDALHANIEAIRRWLGMGGEEGTASWLPVHHDMGLIGCLLTPIANASELWLMLPEQFLRRPLRYLRCFAAGDAHLTSMPSFGLAYIARRVPAAALAGLDFSAWRAIIVGAERIDPLALRRFTALLGPAGLSPAALRPAYGLAEATLAVTGVAMGERWRALGVKPGTLALGRRVSVASGGADVVGCGRPLAGVGVEIRDVRGRPAGEGVVGEVVVAGPAVAGGYLVADPGSPTRIAGGEVRTGDAGFLLDGELFVLGRLGDSLKVRGRHVFAEDLELALVHAGVPAHRLTVLLGDHAGVPTAIAVLERVGAEWGAQAESILRRGAEHARIVVVDAPRGTIQRTSSGKPRRRRLWREFVEDRLAGEVLLDRRPPGASRPDNQPTPDPRGTYV
ncbi:MAG TPA: AMP-binding protein, partial [Solirubrobacteraceae bacterium]|nr:AMP-binding protein [Solirubrobacteraceae bacterium]